jgi:hypothetical protein
MEARCASATPSNLSRSSRCALGWSLWMASDGLGWTRMVPLMASNCL